MSLFPSYTPPKVQAPVQPPEYETEDPEVLRRLRRHRQGRSKTILAGDLRPPKVLRTELGA